MRSYDRPVSNFRRITLGSRALAGSYRGQKSSSREITTDLLEARFWTADSIVEIDASNAGRLGCDR
jgi:hypothetical protein